jgi:hypothetical protein
MKQPHHWPGIEGFYNNWNHQTNWQYSKYESKKILSNLSYLGKLWMILGNFKFSFWPIFFPKKEKRERICENSFFQNNFRQTVKFRHKNDNKHSKTYLQILGTTTCWDSDRSICTDECIPPKTLNAGYLSISRGTRDYMGTKLANEGSSSIQV